jgi:methionyl-tRNA formyltransferase
VLASDAGGITVACGEGALCLTELQRAGSKRVGAAQFLQARPLAAGAVFETPHRPD